MNLAVVRILVALALTPAVAQAAPSIRRHASRGDRAPLLRPSRPRSRVDRASVPTQQYRKLTRGFRFVAGCRAHDCPTKAAAILAPDGSIVSAAIVALPPCADTCEDVSHGRVFIRRATPAWARTALIAWATRVLAVNGRDEPATGRTEVVGLDDAKSP